MKSTVQPGWRVASRVQSSWPRSSGTRSPARGGWRSALAHGEWWVDVRVPVSPTGCRSPCQPSAPKDSCAHSPQRTRRWQRPHLWGPCPPSTAATRLMGVEVRWSWHVRREGSWRLVVGDAPWTARPSMILRWTTPQPSTFCAHADPDVMGPAGQNRRGFARCELRCETSNASIAGATETCGSPRRARNTLVTANSSSANRAGNVPVRAQAGTLSTACAASRPPSTLELPGPPAPPGLDEVRGGRRTARAVSPLEGSPRLGEAIAYIG
jgi:hypothetical protein